MQIETTRRHLLQRRTRIIATLGPACDDTGSISRLLKSGVNLFRLNLSHGDHRVHRQYIRNIRQASEATGIVAAIMADLCGPKIRTGTFREGSAELIRGSSVVVTTRAVQGDRNLIPSRYKKLPQDLQAGNRILLNDGLITLKVISVKGSEINCRVLDGGVISNNKGINLPDSPVSAPALTTKDRQDARFALAQGVDYLCLSFVRSADNILQLRRLIQREKGGANIIAKIETPQALENIGAIIEASDALMVARGDLGVELAPEKVPIVQLQLIDQARAHDRPVIVATQVLESMIKNSTPTRAETSDISYAVTSGTDALMLSAETSVGDHPRGAVRYMDRAIRETEAYRWKSGDFGSFGLERKRSSAFADAIANATSGLSRDLLVRAIIVISNSGMTAGTVSAARPAAPIICFTRHAAVQRKMALYWGAISLLASESELGNPARLARKKARQLKLAKSGDAILLVQGEHSKNSLNSMSITALKI